MATRKRLLLCSAVLFGISLLLFVWGKPGVSINLLEGPWPSITVYVSPKAISDVDLNISLVDDDEGKLVITLRKTRPSTTAPTVVISPTDQLVDSEIEEGDGHARRIDHGERHFQILEFDRSDTDDVWFSFKTPAFAFHKDNSRIQARAPYVQLHSCADFSNKVERLKTGVVDDTWKACKRDLGVPISFLFLIDQEYNLRTDYVSPAPNPGTNTSFTCRKQIQCSVIGNYVLLDEEARDQWYLFFSGVSVGLATTLLGISFDQRLGTRRDDRRS